MGTEYQDSDFGHGRLKCPLDMQVELCKGFTEKILTKLRLKNELDLYSQRGGL